MPEFLSLERIKQELRLEAAADEDSLLLTLRDEAIRYVEAEIEAPLVDQIYLRPAVIALIRDLFNGQSLVKPTAAFLAFLKPFVYKGPPRPPVPPSED